MRRNKVREEGERRKGGNVIEEERKGGGSMGKKGVENEKIGRNKKNA